jgi:hypothetical protein
MHRQHQAPFLTLDQTESPYYALTTAKTTDEDSDVVITETDGPP